MRNKILTAAALLLTLTCSAAELRTEQSIETTARAASFPTSVGRITAKSCEQCPVRTFQLTLASRFFAGREQIDFDTFKKSLGRTPPPALTIHFNGQDNTVTRVVLSNH